MAHGFLQSLHPGFKVFSAGTTPSEKVNPKAIEVMDEAGIDISSHTPHNVSEYINEMWDYVITVCGGANETCPVFLGEVKHRLHFGFDDPSEATGTEDYIIGVFRRVRNEIRNLFENMFSGF